MNIIPHEHNTGFIDPILLKPYEPFRWWEKLKMGGTGSSKVIYHQGIEYFDEKIAQRTDLPIINFELLKKAMLIRLSIHNECYTIAVLKQEILEINVKSFKKDIFLLSLILEVNLFSKVIEFEVSSGNITAIRQYFCKPYFDHL